MRYLLGIDIGTSGTKTVLFTENGRPVRSHTVEYPMSQPHNGWAEQNPEDWWRASAEGCRCVLNGIDPALVCGVGLSGQMHGLVMLDESGRVLRPSIIWCDQRTGEAWEKMEETVGRSRLIEITGNPAMTGFTAAKILWVKEHEPEIYEKCRHILLPKDYIRYMLTGEYATEVSDASGMQLLDIGARNWSAELLQLLDIDRSLLASMHESVEITGQVTAWAAGQTGLHAGTSVVGGAGDNAAAAVGTGVVHQGNAFTTLGTSAVIYAVSDEPHIDRAGRVHSLCASVPGKWTVMSCTQSAGLALRWLRDTAFRTEGKEALAKGASAYDVMSSMAEGVPLGADKLLFLPYLMGERSPHPNPDCRGVFFGLAAMHTPAHLIRAVMEGVAFSQRECLDVFREMNVPVSDMTVVGGGSRSALWRGILRDMYNCPIYTLASDEGGALGAALLAGTGVGLFQNLEEAVANTVHKIGPELPNAENHLSYEPYFELYKKLYKDLFSDFKQLAAL